MKIILVEAEFFLADGQTHRHDEGNSSRLKVKHTRNHANSFTIKHKNDKATLLQKRPSID